MVEIDARKYGMREVGVREGRSVWRLTRRYWFHFLSLVSIVVFMLVWGFSPVLRCSGRPWSRWSASCCADTALIPYDAVPAAAADGA